jgi:hypothetical protein
MDEADRHQSERFAHGLYGLIVITATLIAEQEYIAEPLEAVGLLIGTAFVLFLIHVYIGIMTERSVRGATLGPGRTLVVVDNLPLLGAIVVPVVMFLLAEAGVVSIEVAYTVSVSFSIVALLLAGATQGRAVGLTGARLVLSSLAAAGLGLAMVLVEAAFH